MLSKMNRYLELVTFSHTIFALPFALMSFLTALRIQWAFFSWSLFGWLLVCMVSARTAAMGFNRLVDREIDAMNPRTAGRPLPRGTVSTTEAWSLVIGCCLLFVIACWRINIWTLALSPIALAVILGYSLTKFFTSMTHFILGLALGLAPIGAWIAVSNSLAITPVLLGIGVLLWVAGFDILYSLQDEAVDKKQGLKSLAVKLGRESSLQLSSILHALAVLFFLLFGVSAGFGWVYFLGVLLVAGALIYEHRIISPQDISRINIAFFTVNGFVSALLLVFTIIELYAFRIV